MTSQQLCSLPDHEIIPMPRKHPHFQHWQCKYCDLKILFDPNGIMRLYR